MAATGHDPRCRYAKDGSELPVHVCTTRDGELVRPGQPCWLEGRAQVIEQGRVIHAAERGIG